MTDLIDIAGLRASVIPVGARALLSPSELLQACGPQRAAERDHDFMVCGFACSSYGRAESDCFRLRDFALMICRPMECLVSAVWSQDGVAPRLDLQIPALGATHTRSSWVSFTFVPKPFFEESRAAYQRVRALALHTRLACLSLPKPERWVELDIPWGSARLYPSPTRALSPREVTL